MTSIFNSVYLLIFIQFLRELYRKIIPRPDSGELPKYLILAKFNDKTLLLGYADTYSKCTEYMNDSRWSITISQNVGQIYIDADYIDVGGKPMDSARRRGTDDLPLESIRENRGVNGVASSRDVQLAQKYGFSESKMESIVRRFRRGNYV
jgi:hypothetical protein